MVPKFLIGRKVGMTQVFTETGEVIPVTVVTAGPCPVVQVKTVASDGYSALQLGFEPQKPRRLAKPQLGHFKKAKVEPMRVLREIRLPEDPQLERGDALTVGVFEKGDRVDVVGRSKGHGFQGVVRAWNFKGKRETHGCMNQRGPGSIGMHSEPARVLKGRKMATHWGNERVTVKNLEVVEVVHEHNEIWLRGAVPGPRSGLLVVRAAKTGGVPLMVAMPSAEPEVERQSGDGSESAGQASGDTA